MLFLTIVVRIWQRRIAQLLGLVKHVGGRDIDRLAISPAIMPEGFFGLLPQPERVTLVRTERFEPNLLLDLSAEFGSHNGVLEKWDKGRRGNLSNSRRPVSLSARNHCARGCTQAWTTRRTI